VVLEQKFGVAIVEQRRFDFSERALVFVAGFETHDRGL
jgi:hypothetical protein